MVYEAASGWLLAVSIADPRNPVEVGHYFANNDAQGITLAHGYVFEASSIGLLILQYYGSGVEETPDAELRAPNVKPTFSRSLPAGGVLFDAMGRKVVNPRAGVYFLRDGGGTKKVVVQR
jgi:hypothetical protein